MARLVRRSRSSRSDRYRAAASVVVPSRRMGIVRAFEWAAILIILGIVFAIVSPAIRNAATAGRGAACAGNLQRLGEMFSMYVSDYDGQYPPLPAAPTLDEATQAHTAPETAWMPRLASYQDKSMASRGDKKADPFVCPASPSGAPTYAYNAGLGASVFPTYDPKGQPAIEARIVQPSATFLAFDTANRDQAANNLAGYRFFYGGKNQPAFVPGDFVLPTTGVTSKWMRPRHENGAAIALYCDGHVQRVTDIALRVQNHNPFDPASRTP